MYKDSTTDLDHRLLNASGTQSSAIIGEENTLKPGKELLDSYLLEHTEITLSEAVRSCQGYLSRSYVYDIMSGNRTSPSRDVVIMICLALKADRKNAGRILKAFGHRDLYVRDPRDLVITECVMEEIYNISEVNDRLEDRGLILLGI